MDPIYGKDMASPQLTLGAKRQGLVAPASPSVHLAIRRSRCSSRRTARRRLKHNCPVVMAIICSRPRLRATSGSEAVKVPTSLHAAERQRGAPSASLVHGRKRRGRGQMRRRLWRKKTASGRLPRSSRFPCASPAPAQRVARLFRGAEGPLWWRSLSGVRRRPCTTATGASLTCRR
ncbi:hypothetical protein K505DRAFT_31373, partial [Melanomma pulvis-pyrius CBS 109.77]